MDRLPKGTRLVWSSREEFIEESMRHAYHAVLDTWASGDAGVSFALESNFHRECSDLDEKDRVAKRRSLGSWVEAHADVFTYSDLCVLGVTTRRWAWLVDRAVASWREARRGVAVDAGKGQGNG